MTVVMGDADHLLGEPIIGKPQEGQSLIYDGHSFVPARFVDQNQLESLKQSVAEAEQTAEGALDRTIETQTFLNAIINENRIEIHPLEKNVLDTLTHNVHLLVLQWAKMNADHRPFIIDGFVDPFFYDTSVDLELSDAFHDSEVGSFSQVPAVSGQKFTALFENANQLELSDFRGEINYWRQDYEETGHFEGVENFLGSGSITDKGAGKVGFPAPDHGLSPEQLVRFYGFQNSGYNSIKSVDLLTTENEIVVNGIFVSEETDSSCAYRKIIFIDVDSENISVEPGMEVEFNNSKHALVRIDNSLNGERQISLDSETPSQEVKGIRGLLIGSGGLVMSSARVHDGAANDSSVDSVPTAVNPEDVACSSQTESYEAYKVFDDGHGLNNRWLSARYNTTGWVSYDFGLGGKIINKYRWRTFENESNAVPGTWKLEGSDDNVNWTSLHEGSNIEIGPDTWIPVQSPGYFTFYNSQPYRYYRFNVTANCGHPEYLCMDEIELIESSANVFPESIMVACTKPELVPETIELSAIEHLEIMETKPAASEIFYALSFDSGQNWVIFNNGEWTKIATYESEIWKFRSRPDTLETPPENTMISALKKAFGESLNLMSAQEIASLCSDDWSKEGAWDGTANSIRLAAGLSLIGDEAPRLGGIQITYTEKAGNLRLVSLPISIDPPTQEIRLSFLVKKYDESLRLYAATDDSTQWFGFDNFSKRASLLNGIDFFVTGPLTIHESSQIRLKAECNGSQGSELHGWALNWN